MSSCTIQDAGLIELYFYGELDRVESAEVAAHVRGCRECAAALEELQVIRAALAARPQVSGPPSGNWTAFMDRLDAAIGAPAVAPVVVPFQPRAAAVKPAWTGWLATAALLAIVSASVFVASRAGREATQAGREATQNVRPEPVPVAVADAVPAAPATADGTPLKAGLRTVGLRHLERSKLVVLGIATKDASTSDAWAYERELARGLLNDTRLYRMAAEQRGLASLASVMKDLELVLLQASMAQDTDTTALPQIQRLIAKRGLVEKIDVVGTTGLLP